MSIERLLPQDDPRLRQKCKEVTAQDPSLRDDARALHAALDEFRSRRGFGRAVAAPQLGIMKRLVAVNLGATPFELINPEIIWKSDELQLVWDDCLSLPDIIVRVQRHLSVSLRYEDLRRRSLVWKNLPADLAELVQHEFDHLDGVLMTGRAHGAEAIRPIEEHSALVDEGRPKHRLSLQNISAARREIPSVFLDSPQYSCESLSAALNCDITLKLDFLNPIRNFKGRGASYFVHKLGENCSPTNIVTASAGNWGQALAYSCRRAGIPITIFAAKTANPLKLDRMRALGAIVKLHGVDFDSAKHFARDHAIKCDLFVEDGKVAALSEGHATIAMELLRGGPAFDIVLMPLGNGALLTGVGRWVKAAAPATQVVGVCAVGASAMHQSWQQGRAVESPSTHTIADGIAVRVPVTEAVRDMQGTVDDVLLVDDSQIIAAMRLLARHTGEFVEPAGASALAAVVAHPKYFQGKSVAVMVSGNNLTGQEIVDFGLV